MTAFALILAAVLAVIYTTQEESIPKVSSLAAAGVWFITSAVSFFA